MSALDLRGLVKRYKGETVLDDLNITVEAGETLVLFGPSGAGKTVLLRMIAGVIDPDEGRIVIHGRDMNGVEPEERGVGMAFQNFALFPHMTAYQNIASSIEVKMQSKQQLDEAVQSVAHLLKIDQVLDHAPRALSNGQKQRTALARALVGSPALLLLDDPLRNVDAKLRFEMRIELPALLAQQGTTVIYVTQDYKEAMALADQIVVLNEGRVQQSGSPADVYLSPANTEIARQFGDPAINLLDVTPQRDDTGVSVSLSGQKFYINNTYGAWCNTECVLGMRPESLRLSTHQTDTSIPARVEAVTPLNEKIVTLLSTAGGRELLVSRPAGSDQEHSGSVFVDINSESVLLFDKKSGDRLQPEAEVAG
ncbi:ABC transporter ATP-binding protein [Chromatiales bacterium (ex Bugula neritina AB1)]|nr:ABC transporter ATP-binding protein [Chromatiales bacterium (ex Bugula neritina AB1)]